MTRVVTFDEEFAGAIDDFDWNLEATARADALCAYVPVSGLLLLQAQEFERGLHQLLDQIDATRATELTRATAGRVLAAVEPELSEPHHTLLKSAVDLRNKVMHGYLVIGVAVAHSTGDYEDIGVTHWSHNTDSTWIDEEISGESTLAVWTAELAAATRLLANLASELE